MRDLADQLESLDAFAIARNTSDALDHIVGDWGAVDTCFIVADRSTATTHGRTSSVEGTLVAVRHSGREITTRVLVTAEGMDDPHCAPVIEPVA